jgi:large subunit ribosomal protein L3
MGLELLGRKLGMTQIFMEDGDCIPVTVLGVGPCVVVQKKSEEKEGYTGLQLGFEECKEKHTTMPERGHFAKAGVSNRRFLFECRVTPEIAEGLQVGDTVDLQRAFEGAKKVDVSGVTKGRGFAGVIKRWSFHQPKNTHGTHEYFRHGGSSGSGTYPGRVIKGKRMPGRYGAEHVTQLALRVAKIDAERNLLYVRGAVPGHADSVVRVRVSTR